MVWWEVLYGTLVSNKGNFNLSPVSWKTITRILSTEKECELNKLFDIINILIIKNFNNKLLFRIISLYWHYLDLLLLLLFLPEEDWLKLKNLLNIFKYIK